MNYKSNKILDWDKPTREAKVLYLFSIHSYLYVQTTNNKNNHTKQKTQTTICSYFQNILLYIYVCVQTLITFPILRLYHI